MQTVKPFFLDAETSIKFDRFFDLAQVTLSNNHVLAEYNARLGGDAIRYVFIEEDF